MDSKAMFGKLKWREAAEIIGRRWRARYKEHGYSGLWDYRKRSPTSKAKRSTLPEKRLSASFRFRRPPMVATSEQANFTATGGIRQAQL